MIGMKSTMLRTEESRVKQIKLSNWVYEVLRQTAEDKNQRISKGVIAVEALSMHPDTEYPHPLKSVEKHLDAELNDVRPGLTDEINEIGGGRTVEEIKEQVAETAGEEGHGLPDDVDPDDMVEYQRKFWFPTSVYEELPERYVNREIEAALEYVIESAYHSLQSRINAKSEVLEYVARGTEPEHRVARAVCRVDDYDILSDVPQLDATDTNNSESSLDDSGDEWWARDDLTLDELQSREHTADGDGLSQRKQEERVQALATALENDGGKTRADAANVVEKVYDVTSDLAIEGYLDDVEDVVGDVYASPLESGPVYSTTIYDNLEKFEEYADDPTMQAKVLDKLFETYIGDTGSIEYSVHHQPRMADDWFPLQAVMYQAGWISKSQLEMKAGKFTKNHLIPLLDEAEYKLENYYAINTADYYIVLDDDDRSISPLSKIETYSA